jgi:serine/threonine protein kinase
MYADNASDARVVLVDFGLGSTFGEDELHNDVVGSWTYMSPDVSTITYTHTTHAQIGLSSSSTK